MATLVQQPELAQVQVSNLQATQRPAETEFGLSDFAMGLIGAANQFTDKYNEENRDRLIALGISDYMNQDTRDVSFLERKYYKQGNDYGAVISAQTQRRQQFQSELNRMAEEGADEDTIFQANKEFLQSTVDDIYGADLDTDLKEKLYQETLKENLQYQKLIGEKLQAVAKDKFTQTARLVGAKVITDLTTLPKTPQEQVEYVNTQFEQIKQHAMTSGFAKTEQEAHDAAVNTMKGSFDFWFKSIDPKAPNAAESYNQLRGVAENLFTNGAPELATDILSKVNDAQVKLFNINDDNLNRELTLDLHNFTMKDIDYTPEQISEKFNMYLQSGLYNSDTLTSWYNKYLGVFEQRAKEALDGDSIQNILAYDNHIDYTTYNTGKSKDKWLDATVTDAAREVAESGDNTRMGLALNLIDRANRSSVYMPELMQRAMIHATTELAQYARMSDEEIRNTGGWEGYQRNWNGLVQRYKQLEKSNPQAAEDMIASIDEKYFPNKEVLRGLLQTGAPLNTAYKALQDPVGSAKQLANVRSATSKMTLADAKLDRFWTVGNNGQWFNRINDNAKHTVLNSMQTHATRYQGILAPYMSSDNAGNLVNGMERAGLMVSTKYTPVMVNPELGRAINSGTMRASNGDVLAKEYISGAIDSWRALLSQRYGKGVRPEEVIVQEQGGSFYFLIHDKDGNLQNITPYAGQQGAELSINRILNTAYILKKADADKAQKQVVKVKQEQRNGFGAVGFGTAAQTQGAPEYLVRPQAIMQRSAVRDHNTGKMIPVNIPNSMAAPFGYNKQLAMNIANTWNNFEGWTDTPTVAVGQAGTTSTTSNVIGWGITRKWHPDVHAQMARAKNTQERMNILANYLPKYYEKAGLNKIVASAGLPQPTTAPYPKHLEGVYTMIADATWHGGSGGGQAIAAALKEPTFDAALRTLKSSSVYRGISSNGSYDRHPRNIWRVNTLRQYYNSKALMQGSNVTVGGRTYNPTKIPNKTFVPYKPK